jgi:hypothetical protein
LIISARASLRFFEPVLPESLRCVSITSRVARNVSALCAARSIAASYRASTYVSVRGLPAASRSHSRRSRA